MSWTFSPLARAWMERPGPEERRLRPVFDGREPSIEDDDLLLQLVDVHTMRALVARCPMGVMGIGAGPPPPALMTFSSVPFMISISLKASMECWQWHGA